MEIKKFTTYEFSVNGVDVAYKVDENNRENSIVAFTENGKEVVLSASMVAEISKAMREIDPFEFAFEGE